MSPRNTDTNAARCSINEEAALVEMAEEGLAEIRNALWSMTMKNSEKPKTHMSWLSRFIPRGLPLDTENSFFARIHTIARDLGVEIIH
jgi:hypothetical protein